MLPSLSEHYLLQSYAYQLYNLLDRCGFVDKDLVKKPPDFSILLKGRRDFVTEIFEEAFLRTITSYSHECLQYYGGKVIDLDLATIVKPRLTVALDKVKDKCRIEGIDATLLRIPMFLPSDFSISLKEVGKPDNLFEIVIKSRYCDLKVKVRSYAWLGQVVLRTEPIPMLDEMPITSASLD